MVEQITFQIVFQFLQTVSIMVGIAYYLMILRNNERNRQTDMLMFRFSNFSASWYRAWTNVLNMNYGNYEDWQEKYGRQSNPEAYADWIYVGTLYNNLGLLLQEKQIHPDILFKQFLPASVLRIWRKYETVVNARRELTGSTVWSYFEYLYDEAVKRTPDVTLPEDY